MPSSKSSSNGGRHLAGLICTLVLLSSQHAHASPPPVSDPHTIGVWAYSGISDQVSRWESAFQALHPEVRFHNEFHGAAAVMAGLYNGVGDLAFMGREIWPVETMAYQWVYQQQPFGVMVATAGLRAPGQLFTPVILVNSKNPIDSITLSQLDAIFGSEHRVAPANIRTWGELGLQGDSADKPIHPYGFSGEDALGVFFRRDVLRAHFKPNPDTTILSDRDNSRAPAATRIQQAIATDPYAIGYSLAAKAPDGIRVLPVGAPDPVRPNMESLANHTYPLTRSMWVYIRRGGKEPVSPDVDSFVRFVLSPEGQALVGPSEQLLPLTPDLQKQQLNKLTKPPQKPAAAEDN